MTGPERCALALLATLVVMVAGCGGDDPEGLTADATGLAAAEADLGSNVAADDGPDVAADDGPDVAAEDDPTREEAGPDADDAPPSEPTGEFAVAAEWDWALETEDGYRLSGTLELGETFRAEHVPVLSEAAAPGIDVHCGNGDTDAYIPAALTLTNETPGFDHRLSNNFYLATTEGSGALIYKAPDDLLMAAPLYTSGVECRNMATADDVFFGGGRGWNVSFSHPAAPGESRGPHLAYLVLPNYFTPANPTGDVDRLDAVGLAIVPAMSGDDARLTSLTGPDTDSNEDGGAFLLSAVGGRE